MTRSSRNSRRFAAFETWISLHILNENVANIVRQNGLFNQRAFDLLSWSIAQGRDTEVLQMLADDPPNGSPELPNLIYFVTDAEMEPSANKRTGIKPIDPHDDFFVTQRPFANRKKLRDMLKAFDQGAARRRQRARDRRRTLHRQELQHPLRRAVRAQGAVRRRRHRQVEVESR